MKKLIITTIVLAATLAAGTAQAGIFGWGNNRGLAVQRAPVAVISAPVATASTENGYRSFSYLPAPAYVAPTYGYATRQPAVSGGSFHDAGWKIRGF